jgi:hypothetical protein
MPAKLEIQASIFLLFFLERFVILIQIAVYPRQLQRFHTDNLVLSAAFFAGNHIAFFNFVHFDV